MMDVIVVGGGAAGLSAALVLGRSRRRAIVVDDGRPRNAPAAAAHNILARDGTPPAELLRAARAQLAPYASVAFREGRVVAASARAGGFVVRLADGTDLRARRLLLAVGVRDQLPAIDGLAPLWGSGVLHCPYCHGWEVRDRPIALLAAGATAMEMAPLLLQLSRDLLLCANGGDLGADDRARLFRHGARIADAPVRRLEGNGALERIVFADGRVEPRHALFLRPAQAISCDLPRQLGCELTDAGLLRVESDLRTSVPGVYAAGDATTPSQQVAVAAATGVQAAMAINRDLATADFAAG
jgi:thioredoxin reductase